MADVIYNSLKKRLMDGSIDFDADTIKVALVTSLYSPDQDNDDLWGAGMSAWAASTAYSVGDIVVPTTANGYYYECTVAGTSDTAEPTWPTTIGNTVADGGATWQCKAARPSEYEVSGTGYTAGGAALANKTVTQDNTDNEGVFDADDVTWSTSTITARGAVLYKDGGSAATRYLICYIDFGADKSSEAADFTLQWNAEGILNIN